jgi:transcriptional regulator with XRE-family HTH domain
VETQVKRRKETAQKSAATNDRNFRTFLLVAQLEAQAIGARLAQARNEAGMTQEQVADLATFSKRSLQDYEYGVTIPYRHMREIAGILARPVEWFLHGDQQEEMDLLQEVAASVDRLSSAMATALLALERIEDALGSGGAEHKGKHQS